LLRWTDQVPGSDEPAVLPEDVPLDLQVLTPAGWVATTLGMSRRLWGDGTTGVARPEAARAAVTACCRHRLDADRRRGLIAWFAGSGPRWLISPPLRLGAERIVERCCSDNAEGDVAEQLPTEPPVRAELEAQAGLERARDRQAGIERRTLTVFQAAGVTTTLVLANSALLRGDDAVTGTTALWVLGSLMLATGAMITAGLFAMFGAMRPFDRLAPDDVHRVVVRAQASEIDARRRRIAAILVAQRRTSIISDWKLARLRRAVWALLFGIGGLAITSATLIVDEFGP
jgi:hypothetical protein